MGVGAAHAPGIVVWLLVIFQTSACASDLVYEGDRYRDRGGRYSIARPGGDGSTWRPLRAEGTRLSFRGPGGATMSLVEQCGRSQTLPRILARQLLIGVEGRTLLDEGPVGEDPSRGWIQRLEASANGAALQLKTVTQVVGRCSYDWILVVPGRLEGSEAVFDAWWQSFRSDGSEAGGEGER